MVPLGDSHTEARVSMTPFTCFGMRTLLQLELLNTSLIGSDGGALDTDTILLDSLGSLNGDLVIGLVTVFETLQCRSVSIQNTKSCHRSLPGHST